MADIPTEANLGQAREDSDPDDVEGALGEFRRRIAASQERVSDLKRELNQEAYEEAEAAQRLEVERERRATLDQQLREAWKEAASLILHQASREARASPASDVDAAAGTKIASEETTDVANERDRLASEVAELTKALAEARAARAAQAESSKTVESLRRERYEIPAHSEQALADQAGEARTMADEQDEANRSAESQDEELPDDERPTRYERASARLPSIGDDASQVIGSLEDLRESLRHH